MKRRGISVFAGLASAGALALTGLVGTQAVVGAETVESIDHIMEVNESSLTESGDMGMVGTVEDMDSFHDVLFRKDGSWLGAGTLYTTTKLKGLDAEVFLETQSGWNGSTISSDTFPNTLELKDPNHEIYDMHVYANIGGKIIHAGRLQTDFTHPIKIKDGVIYACNEKSFETYLVSKMEALSTRTMSMMIFGDTPMIQMTRKIKWILKVGKKNIKRFGMSTKVLQISNLKCLRFH